MPRKPRTYLPGVTYHVVQRGNNRQDCFFAPHDFKFYLDCLTDACRRKRVEVHAWVLMTNHVHLLMTPATEQSISAAMQSLGRRYVQHVNKLRGRSGTLWEGRHHESAVQTERYLLACYRYIEVNPVAAGIVGEPAEYRWSSYRCNALGRPDGLVTPHAVFEALGSSASVRRAAYCALFSTPIPSDDLDAIRTGERFSMPVGDARFKAGMARRLGRSLGHARRGRPRGGRRTSGNTHDDEV